MSPSCSIDLHQCMCARIDQCVSTLLCTHVYLSPPVSQSVYPSLPLTLPLAVSRYPSLPLPFRHVMITRTPLEPSSSLSPLTVYLHPSLCVRVVLHRSVRQETTLRSCSSQRPSWPTPSLTKRRIVRGGRLRTAAAATTTCRSSCACWCVR
jgi:hypothetical protein